MVILGNRARSVEGQERNRKVLEGRNAIYLELSSATIGWCRQQFQVQDPNAAQVSVGIRGLATI